MFIVNTSNIENLVDSCKICNNWTNCLKNKYLCPAFSLSMDYLATLLRVECAVDNVEVRDMLSRIPEDFRGMLSKSVQFKDFGGKLLPVGVDLKPLLLDSVSGQAIAKELIRKVDFFREGKDLHLAVSGIDGALLLCTVLPLSNKWKGVAFLDKSSDSRVGVSLAGKGVILLGCELHTGDNLIKTMLSVERCKGKVIGAVVVINRCKGPGAALLKERGLIVKCLMEAKF